MSKKLVWPLAKLRKEDQCPAVWLSWGVWQAIKGGLINSYLLARASKGRSDARILAGKPDPILDSWRTDATDAENALTIYRLGFAHNVPPASVEKYPDIYITPAQLVALGDKRERQSAAEQFKALWEGPVAKEIH